MDYVGETGDELRDLSVDCNTSDQEDNMFSFDDVSDCVSPYAFPHDLEPETHHLLGVAVIALFFETVNKFRPNPSSVTYTWFGFSELPEAEHPNLVGLYQELILELGLTTMEFILAFKGNSLFDMILSKYFLMRKKVRGKFYKWVCSRKEVFDSLKPMFCVIHYRVYPRSGFSQKSWPGKRIPMGYHPGDQVATLKDMYSRIAVHFPREDDPSVAMSSKNEIAVTVLYYEILTSKIPTKCSITYYSFGFSKVHPLDILSLADLYSGLICDLKCTRRQFLKAYEAGELYELIDSQFSKLPATSRRSCYGEWFVPRTELFNSLKPLSPLPSYPPSAYMKFLPISMEESDEISLEAEVHACVRDYLTEDERREGLFKDMTSNKVAVLHLFYIAIRDRGDVVPHQFSCHGDSEDFRKFNFDRNALPVYRTLILCVGCKVQEFLEAYESGEVMELIQSKYSQLPRDDRGFYCNEWFPENRDVFESMKPAQVPSPKVVLPGVFDGMMDEELEDDEHCDMKGSLSGTEGAVALLYNDIVRESFQDLHPTTRRCFGFDNLGSIDQFVWYAILRDIIVNSKCKKQVFWEAYVEGKVSHLIESEISKSYSNGLWIKGWLNQHRSVIVKIKPPSNHDRPSSSGVKMCRACRSRMSGEKLRCFCGKLATVRCSRCKEQLYCSKAHRTGYSKKHEKDCVAN